MNKKVLKNYDFTLLLTILAISLFGVLVIGASTTVTDGGRVSLSEGLVRMLSSGFFIRQLIWVIAGFAAMVVLSLIDYNEWRRFIIPIYLFNMVLLALVMIMGFQALGAQRWISVGGFFNLQPSEFAKVAIIITLSVVMAKEGRELDSWFDLAIPAAHVGAPMLLIFLQPDLGTSLVFIAITGGILFVAGLKWLHLAVLSVGGAMASVLAFFFVLKPYQRGRLIIFTDPWADFWGVGWQIIQSMVAIGAGGFYGTGLFRGTQNQLNFLPEKHTDFIFSVIGEELGFVGASLTLLVYLYMILRIYHVGMEAKDSFGRYICVGVATMMVFQLLVNVGMTISIMPVTGLPLPLLSYGGSSFLATALALGLVLSVAAHKDTSMF